MSDRTKISPEVVAAFTDSIQHILDRIMEETIRAEEPDDPFDFDEQSFEVVVAVIQIHLQNYSCLITCCESWMRELKVGDDVAVVHRAMGRVEAYVDTLRVMSAEIRSWRATGEYAVARHLLASVYEHMLHDIQAFFERVVEAVADPIAAAEKQELATLDSVESSRVTIDHDAQTVDMELIYEMTPAPALSELVVWMRRMLRREEQESNATGHALRHKYDSSRTRHERGSILSSSFLYGGLIGLGLGMLDDD